MTALPKAGVHSAGELSAAGDGRRTLALVHRSAGNEAVARVYEEIGNRIHEGDEKLSPGVVATALAAAGLNPDPVDAGLGDDSTMDD